MSTQTLEKHASPTQNQIPASICWFEIPADNIERARSFYSSLFGWKIKPMEAAARPYWVIETGGADASPDGGMMERQCPDHRITNYISVASVEEAAARVEKLGGKIDMPKTAVPQMGYFVVCRDTENNAFALWEPNANAQ
jgi:uncharacterized protein